MKQLLLSLTLLLAFGPGISGQNREQGTKVILVTMDGFRWQELFSGADSLLIASSAFVEDTLALKEAYWRNNPQERRKALMPFLWTEGIAMGQLHGNRVLGSHVDLTNKMWFSYPGYNEILTGKADDGRITSNDKLNNPNTTILEIANKDSRYRAKVAAFGSWDVFPFIINEDRSNVPVNAGFGLAQGADLTERERFLNELQPRVPSPWTSVRLDAFTNYYAMEYMKREHPSLVYIAFGETDDFAHDGNYEAYLNSAHNTDTLLKGIWEYTQTDDFYKDQTVFVITTDHGRGTEPQDAWKSHGKEVKGAGSVWLILFGHGIPVLGEVDRREQLFTKQIAPTVLKILGVQPGSPEMDGKPLPLGEK